MSEKEIRRIIQEVCSQLDRQARKAVYPAIIGAGLAMGGCSGDAEPVYGVPAPDSALDAGLDRGIYGMPVPDAIYAAPDQGKRLDGIIPRDVAIYAAVDVNFMDMKKTDKGGAPEYAAPIPDKG